MSEEFIEYHFPCSVCIVQAACKDRQRIRGPIEKVETGVPSLGVPKFKKGKTYHKGILECLMNVQKRVMDKVSRTEGPNRVQEKDKLPMQYLNVMIGVSEILCHMVNSTSWEEGELFEFDRIEIKRRLSKLEGWL